MHFMIAADPRKQERCASRRYRGGWATPTAAAASLITGGACNVEISIQHHGYLKENPEQLVTDTPGQL